MRFIVKQPKRCTWKEFDIFLSLIGNLSLISSSNIKKIAKLSLLGICIDKGKAVGISAIKHPKTTWIEKLRKNTGIQISKNCLEYGYIYVLPTYRGLGITKKLYTLLLKKTHSPLYAVTKTDNIPMKKLLQTFSFIKTGRSFRSVVDGEYLDFYLKRL